MYRFICNIIKAFMSIIFRVEVHGSENIPQTGGFILCSNHISAWDPPLLQVFIDRRVYFMAKDELFHIFFDGMVLKMIKAIPVKRSGSDITAIKTAMKHLKDDEVLGIFPTGQREKVKGEGEVKGGVALMALKTGTRVVPVHIDATYRLFSKIKINIGSPRLYELPEGERKVSPEIIERVSHEIYAGIKSLGEE